MFIDYENELSDSQSVTASAASTNYIDFGDAKDHAAGNPVGIEIVCDETVASGGGSATVAFYLHCDTTSTRTPDKSFPLTGAIAQATLVEGYVVYRGMLPHGLLRYLWVYYEVASGPLTAGKFSARLLQGFQSNVNG